MLSLNLRAGQQLKNVRILLFVMLPFHPQLFSKPTNFAFRFLTRPLLTRSLERETSSLPYIQVRTLKVGQVCKSLILRMNINSESSRCLQMFIFSETKNSYKCSQQGNRNQRKYGRTMWKIYGELCRKTQTLNKIQARKMTRCSL